MIFKFGADEKLCLSVKPLKIVSSFSGFAKDHFPYFLATHVLLIFSLSAASFSKPLTLKICSFLEINENLNVASLTSDVMVESGQVSYQLPSDF